MLSASKPTPQEAGKHALSCGKPQSSSDRHESSRAPGVALQGNHSEISGPSNLAGPLRPAGFRGFYGWARQDSNLRPIDYESTALTN